MTFRSACSNGCLRLYELGHNEIDHAGITEIEAAAFIDLAVVGAA